MRVFVTAKPNAKEESIEKIDDAYFRMAVKEPPIDGRANKAILRLLAEYFRVSISALSIISGRTNRRKIIEVKL